MQYFWTFFIVLSLSSLTAQAQYTPCYYYRISKAVLLLGEGDCRASLQLYESLMEEQALLPQHYFGLAETYACLGKKKVAFEWLERAFTTGGDNWERAVFSPYFQKWKRSKGWRVLERDYPKKRQSYVNQMDVNLYMELREMYSAEQFVRASVYKPGDTLTYEYVLMVDSINMHRLVDLVEQKGFPQYHAIGPEGYQTFCMLLTHTTTHNEWGWNYFKELLEQEIKTGNFFPAAYAIMIDNRCMVSQKGEQRYGQYNKEDSDNFNPIGNLEEVDKRRLALGLLTLNDFSKKKYSPSVLPDQYIPIEKPLEFLRCYK